MKIKRTISLMITVALALALAGCGGSSAGTEETTDEGRLITGEVLTEAAASVAKAQAVEGSCLGEVCSVAAMNSEGEEVAGEIDPATNRWRVRLRAGNWMIGFLDGDGQRLGSLALNGITALTIEDGDDVDLGRMYFRNNQMNMDDDVEGLGEDGIFSYYGQDSDRDGIPAAFEDELAFNPDAFNVLFIRPFDGQPHVAPCRPVKIVFTKALSEISVTADTVQVTYEDGSPVAGELSVWDDAQYHEYEVTFTPIGGFEMDATVMITVASGENGVASADGDLLDADVSTSFIVRDWGSTSTVCHDPDHERQRLRHQNREQNGSGPAGGDEGQQE